MCEPCAQGQYQPNRGMAECRPCGQGTSSGVSATQCDLCDTGYYKAVAVVEAASAPMCMPCAGLSGVECGWNTTVKSMGVQPTFWRHSERTIETYLCLTRDDAWSPCVGSGILPEGPARRRLALIEQGDENCAEGQHLCLCARMPCASPHRIAPSYMPSYCSGYRGPKCELCSEPDHYFRQNDAKCHECTSAWRTLGWVIFGIVVGLLFIVLIFAVAWRKGWLERNTLSRTVTQVRTAWRFAGMQAKSKLLINFYLVAASIPSVYNVSLPSGRYASWVQMLEWPNSISLVSAVSDIAA